MPEKNGQKKTSVNVLWKQENKTKILNSLGEIEGSFKDQNKVWNLQLNSRQKMHIY